MLPAMKVYDVDYDFLISNYLNKELWKKKWNLFIYKNNVFTLNLYCIYTHSDCIVFEIRYNKLDYTSNSITYYPNNSNINILKQQINGAMFRLMEEYDEELCKKTQGYKSILDMYEEERDVLRETAENYLDSCGVTQEDIRDCYIDAYVSNNTKCDVYKSNYLYGHKYEYLTEMFIVFTKITNDKNRYNTIVNRINDSEYIKKIENDINEFKEYFGTDEYAEDIQDNLDEIF